MTKRQLQDLYWTKKAIKKYEERLLELEAQATKTTTRLSHDPRGTGNSDPMVEAITNMDELKREINHVLKRAYAMELEVQKAIAVLPERDAFLIRLRYIECMNWDQIMEEMGYEWAHVHRIHAEALKLLA